MYHIDDIAWGYGLKRNPGESDESLRARTLAAIYAERGRLGLEPETRGAEESVEYWRARSLAQERAIEAFAKRVSDEAATLLASWRRSSSDPPTRLR